MIRRIWLALDEPKCIGSACRYPKPCARRDIPADKGRPLADFSIGAYIPDCCGPAWRKFIPYSQAVEPEKPQQVKEWIGR